MWFWIVTLIISANEGCVGAACFFLDCASFLGDDMADIPKEWMSCGYAKSVAGKLGVLQAGAGDGE